MRSSRLVMLGAIVVLAIAVGVHAAGDVVKSESLAVIVFKSILRGLWGASKGLFFALCSVLNLALGGISTYTADTWRRVVMGQMTHLEAEGPNFVSGAYVNLRPNGQAVMNEFRNTTQLSYMNVLEDFRPAREAILLKKSAVAEARLDGRCVHVTFQKNGRKDSQKYCKGQTISTNSFAADADVEEACSGRDFFLVRLRKGDDLEVFYFTKASSWNAFIEGRKSTDVARNLLAYETCKGPTPSLMTGVSSPKKMEAKQLTEVVQSAASVSVPAKQLPSAFSRASSDEKERPLPRNIMNPFRNPSGASGLSVDHSLLLAGVAILSAALL